MHGEQDRLRLESQLGHLSAKIHPSLLLISKTLNCFEPQFPNLRKGGGRERQSRVSAHLRPLSAHTFSDRPVGLTLVAGVALLLEFGSASVGRYRHPSEQLSSHDDCEMVDQYSSSSPSGRTTAKSPGAQWGRAPDVHSRLLRTY